MEETSGSATFGQSILATKGERLSALVIPAGSLFSFCLSPFSLLSSPFIVFVFVFLISHLSFVISHLSFLISHLSFLILSSFSFLICHLSFLICHLSFLISSSFSFHRLSHFVAQISANVNIYRIDSSFLHIICAFLA